MSSLTIGIYQLDTIWQAPYQNLKKVSNLLFSLDSTPDILVLPEMWATGFSMMPEQCAISIEDPFLTEIQKLATTHNICIVGSLPICQGGSFHNRALWITPNGIEAIYDKQYLFSPSGESKRYVAGEQCKTFSYKDWLIKLQICYDLRFPEGVRDDQNPDLIIYMANWPKKRIKHWQHLLTARAIENQAYVVGCNRIGVDENQWTYPGSSHIIHPDGTTIMNLKEKPYKSIIVTLDEVALYRTKYPFYLDKK